MFGLIASQTFAEDIQNAIDGDLLFKTVGVYRESEIVQHILSAGRVNLDTLIIDLDSCKEESAVIKGIHQLKMSRPGIRIVIVAVDRKPGNQTLSQLVSLGIYDIITPLIPESEDGEIHFDLTPHVKNQLERSSTYADVARFHFMYNEWMTDEKKPQAKVEEKIIIREKMVGTVIIAVGGVDRKTGTTHLAIQLAAYLARLGYRTACVELPCGSPSSFFSFRTDEATECPGGFSLQNVDFFPDREDHIYRVLSAGYDYVIFDLGSLFHGVDQDQQEIVFHPRSEEFFRADLSVLTAGASFWDFYRFLKVIKFLQENKTFHSWTNVFNFADKRLFQEIQRSFNRQDKKNMPMLWNPFQPDPFLSVEEDNRCQELLKTVLPQERERKPLFQRFFRRAK